MDFDATLTKLNIQLGDTSNTTFTVEEKTRALTKAWNDRYMVKTKWDTSLTFSANTYTYNLPSGVKTIKDIYIKRSSTDAPEPIPSDAWEVINGVIYLTPVAQAFMVDGWTMYLKYNQKLDPDTDTISDENLQEYVIALAGYETLTLLGYKKANLFLKNDTTMGELIQLRREFKRDVDEYRRSLPKEYENA